METLFRGSNIFLDRFKMKFKRIHILLAVLVLCVCAIPFRARIRVTAVAIRQLFRIKKTVAQRVVEYGEVVHKRLAPDFEKIKTAYPPRKITLVGIKSERILQVWVAADEGHWKHLKDYPVLGMSGVLGPKLQFGDQQVPEGLYRVESLNPNSLLHLALRVSYPNEFDRRKGESDGRDNLGSDIMIHGSNLSAGCLAMGDEAAEDLFVLAAQTGIENISIILTPVDFRTHTLPAKLPDLPKWSDELYGTIKSELSKLTNSP